MQSLTDRLAAMAVKPRKRRRQKARAPLVPGAAGTIQVTAAPRKPRRRQRRPAQSASVGAGDIRLTRSEMVREVTVAANATSASGQFALGPPSFAFLKNLYGSFERYRWHSLSVYYKPAVGTTTNGLVSYGIDYTASKTDQTRVQISTFTPNASHAVWADSTNKQLVVPKNMLMSREWYVDGGDTVDKVTGNICYAATTTAPSAKTVLGELWVKYDVELAGTRS